jgi:signal transduction histidine kinase
MAFWHNPLLRKTFGFMLLGLLALGAIIATSLWLTDHVNENADEVVRERQVRTQAAALLAVLRDAEIGQRGYLLTDEPRYLAPYERVLPQIPGLVEKLQELAQRIPRIAGDVEEVRGLTATKLEELARTIALVKDGKRTEAMEVIRTDVGLRTMDGLRTTLVRVVSDSDRRVAELLTATQSDATALFWVTTSSTLLILLLAAAAAYTVARHTRELVDARHAVVAANLSLEERVQERTGELARANEEIQRFAYIVSHDLRAPLVNIVGFTSELETSMQTLQRFVGDGAEPAAETTPEAAAQLAEDARLAANSDLPEAVGFIRASTTKMDRLINAILKISREGRRELRPEHIDLKALFDAGAASVQHQLEQIGARIDVPPRMPGIVSDRLALEQVFGNLIDNAVKYFSPDRPGEIKVSAAAKGGTVTVTVADNGRGIAPSDHERIFELFRRSGVQNVPGEGIGLANVRALVRRLGGEIQVESELGTGSRFTVTLPQVLTRRTEGKA